MKRILCGILGLAALLAAGSARAEGLPPLDLSEINKAEESGVPPVWKDLHQMTEAEETAPDGSVIQVSRRLEYDYEGVKGGEAEDRRRERLRGYPRGGVHWGGPRIGLTYITDGAGFDELKELVGEKTGIEPQNTLSQFGWHLEYRMFTTESGLTAFTEFLPMVAGLDQGLALPSANLVMGVRSPGGLEFGFGPNFSARGAGLVLATGYTVKTGGLNFPLNLAASFGKQSVGLTFVTGFNLQRD